MYCNLCFNYYYYTSNYINTPIQLAVCIINHLHIQQKINLVIKIAQKLLKLAKMLHLKQLIRVNIMHNKQDHQQQNFNYTQQN